MALHFSVYLLILHKALNDHYVHSIFDKRGLNRFSIVVAFAVVQKGMFGGSNMPVEFPHLVEQY
jgi:hypothetical protein